MKSIFKHQDKALNIAHVIGSDSLEVFDKNGNEICEGYVIKHNQNLFLIKMSPNLKQWVARASEGMNWRDFDWIKKVAKYCEIVGNIHFSKEIWERWKHCLQQSANTN